MISWAVVNAGRPSHLHFAMVIITIMFNVQFTRGGLVGRQRKFKSASCRNAINRLAPMVKSGI
jgi:hypothetical protein